MGREKKDERISVRQTNQPQSKAGNSAAVISMTVSHKIKSFGTVQSQFTGVSTEQCEAPEPSRQFRFSMFVLFCRCSTLFFDYLSSSIQTYTLPSLDVTWLASISVLQNKRLVRVKGDI